MNKLINAVCMIELYNLKKVCQFYYMGTLYNKKKIYLTHNDFIIKNENIIIKNNLIDVNDKWINTFYFKDVYKDDNLFYDYLKNKYRV